jgi:hypothetical protein
MDVTILFVLLFLFVLVWLIWGVMFLSHDPGDELRQVKRHQFLGPGGPDDPFADDPYDE